MRAIHINGKVYLIIDKVPAEMKQSKQVKIPDKGGLTMSVFNKIAYFQKRRDDAPNIELAKELAKSKNRKGIQEIAENLYNKNKNIQSDCIKVLYEIGYINPELIADYVDDFLKFLKNKNNRMVWGAMTGLSTIAEIKSEKIWEHIDEVIIAVRHGSAITVAAGVKTLARVASTNERYNEKIFPLLIEHLKKCNPRNVPMYAESILCIINEGNKNEFLSVLESRKDEMKASQRTRLKKVLKKLDTQ